jgi:hypothetical protein
MYTMECWWLLFKWKYEKSLSSDIKPQFHWTDQKIIVHYFVCIIGYLISTLLWREAKIKTEFGGTLDTLLDKLNNIRLGAILEEAKKGRARAVYKLEEMEFDEKQLMEAFDLLDFHLRKPKLNSLGVYT